VNAAQEVELKLELDPGDMAVLLADTEFAGGAMSSCEQHSVYFDTEDGDLRKAGLSLRVRRIGDRRVQTLKAGASPAAAGLFARDEWEREIEADAPDLDPEMAEIIRSKVGHPIGPLEALFTASVVRSRRITENGGASIELVADRGSVISGERREAICEIEMELRDGEPAALFDMARKLDRRVPLRLGVRTKSERGYGVAAGAKAAATKAEPVKLRADMNAAAVFQAIAGSCIRHFRLNEELILAAGDAEAVHQARVAIRRLRSAISIFKAMLAGPDADRLTGELKWIMGVLGEVRNLDVLLGRIDDAALNRRVRVARRIAIGDAVAALESPRLRQLMLDLAEWVAIGDWLESAPAWLRNEPAPEAAADAMERQWRRVRKKGRKLATLDEPALHEVRIRAKKARYAAEFFADLFDGGKARRRRTRFLAAIEDLQSHLGDLNDTGIAAEALAKAGIVADPALIAPAEQDREALLAKAERAYDELAETKLFWR
jgi:inorganic triphosphatase YgiF